MRKITRIIIHCSATRCNRRYTVEQCRHDHIFNRGWRDIGYHYYIERDGQVRTGRPLAMVGAHCKGYNATSIGVCYEGGLDVNGKPADTRTPDQIIAMQRLINSLQCQFPEATVHGHREFANKACPCFDVN